VNWERDGLEIKDLTRASYPYLVAFPRVIVSPGSRSAGMSCERFQT
jgi:hypothetical protein